MKLFCSMDPLCSSHWSTNEMNAFYDAHNVKRKWMETFNVRNISAPSGIKELSVTIMGTLACFVAIYDASWCENVEHSMYHKYVQNDSRVVSRTLESSSGISKRFRKCFGIPYQWIFSSWRRFWGYLKLNICFHSLVVHSKPAEGFRAFINYHILEA